MDKRTLYEVGFPDRHVRSNASFLSSFTDIEPSSTEGKPSQSTAQRS